jgi:hypothetical protein
MHIHERISSLERSRTNDEPAGELGLAAAPVGNPLWLSPPFAARCVVRATWGNNAIDHRDGSGFIPVGGEPKARTPSMSRKFPLDCDVIRKRLLVIHGIASRVSSHDR